MIRGCLIFLAVAAGGAAAARADSVYDPQQLPALRGRVAHYSLTDRDTVDGLIMADGTEVHVPERLSSELVFAVKPGDAVTVHGLKASALPMMQAASVTNDATGLMVLDAALPALAPAPFNPGQPAMQAVGEIKGQLHGSHGEFAGLVLTDGTIVRMQPFLAQQRPDCIVPGHRIVVTGNGTAGVLGRVIEARSIMPEVGGTAPPPAILTPAARP